MINFFSSRRVKVLLVNHNRSEADKFAGFLPIDRFAVITARTSVSGIEIAEKERPEIIILDCELPNRNGWETLSRLKKNAKTAAIPVLMCTAGGDVLSARRAYSDGAQGCIPKPASKEAVVARIERRLGRVGQLAGR